MAVAGCATLRPSFSREATADAIAAKAGFEKERIQAGAFTLLAFTRLRRAGSPITFYIEGDGFAWATKHRLSADPTPFNPVALSLAATDTDENVAYLARPCQYIQDPACEPSLWSDRRFSEPILRALDDAVQRIQTRGNAPQVHLVGYSGGGALAALLAARRQDVASLRTVAGNLDHAALNRHHNVSLLSGSFNAIDVAPQISSIPQEHFIGSRDKIVPAFIAEAFAAKAGNPSCVQVVKVEGVSHDSGWEKFWADHAADAVVCS